MVRGCGLKSMQAPSRALLHWKPWAALGMAALAWWCYAAPIQLAERIRRSAEEPAHSPESSLIASRVDLDRVNGQLSAELRLAANGRLDHRGFAHLLLYGWLPQQKPRNPVDAATSPVAQDVLTPDSVPVTARHTRLTQVRYKSLNRFIAIFWDADQVHEIVLTLQRTSVLHRWQVTHVTQFNVCAYDFDCAMTPVAPGRLRPHP